MSVINADDIVLIAKNRKELQNAITKCAGTIKNRIMKTNVDASKATVITKQIKENSLDIS